MSKAIELIEQLERMNESRLTVICFSHHLGNLMFLGKEGFSQDLEKAYHFKDNKTANDERKRLNIYGKPGYTTCTGLRANEVDPELIVDTVGKKSKKWMDFIQIPIEV